MVPKVGVVRFGFLVGQILSIIGFASAEEFPILKTKTPQETYAKFDGLPVSQIEAARGLERAADAVRRRLELTEATLGSHHYLTKELKLLHSVYLSYLARPQRDQELAQNVFQAKLQDREDRVIAAREDETLEFSKQINKAMDENESYRLDSRLFDKNEFPTRLSQERQSRTVSLRDENVFSTRLLPYVQKVEEVYGKESYLYSEVQRHIAVELKRLARLGAARAFAKDHAQAVAAVFGKSSSDYRNALLLQATIESADGKAEAASEFYHQAVNVSKGLIPTEAPDSVNLAVWTAMLLREGRTNEALETAGELRKLIRASGETRTLEGEKGEELNNLLWATATLTERAYLLEALVVLDYMLKQAESPDNATSSSLARTKYYLLQREIYEKLGRKEDYQQSKAKCQAAWREWKSPMTPDSDN